MSFCLARKQVKKLAIGICLLMLLFARRQRKVVKILIADDHKILREGIKNVLEMESDLK